MDGTLPKISCLKLQGRGGSNLVFKLLEHGHFLMNFRLWLLGVELRKAVLTEFFQLLNQFKTEKKSFIGQSFLF